MNKKQNIVYILKPWYGIEPGFPTCRLCVFTARLQMLDAKFSFTLQVITWMRFFHQNVSYMAELQCLEIDTPA